MGGGAGGLVGGFSGAYRRFMWLEGDSLAYLFCFYFCGHVFGSSESGNIFITILPTIFPMHGVVIFPPQIQRRCRRSDGSCAISTCSANLRAVSTRMPPRAGAFAAPCYTNGARPAFLSSDSRRAFLSSLSRLRRRNAGSIPFSDQNTKCTAILGPHQHIRESPSGFPPFHFHRIYNHHHLSPSISPCTAWN